MLLPVTATIALDESELLEEFVRASGPGGQHVNKVESAVRLRFHAAHSPNLPDAVRARLLRLAGRRATTEGVIVIAAQRFRERERNRADAQSRLFELIRAAAAPPPPKRRPTRPTAGSERRRIEGKARRATVKSLRGRPESE